MTVSQAVIVGSAVVMVLLVVVVAWLSSRLSQLSRQVHDLQTAPEQAPPPASRADARPRTDTPAAASADPTSGLRDEAADEEVSVITHLDLRTGDEPTTARIATVSLGGPLIKVAAFTHGVRRALREEHRMRVAYAVRKELRRQHKTRRRGRAERAPSQRWRP
ncbi:MAG: hypothetical protein ACR2FP_09570 [Nocardioidaceae bacterium]